MNEKARSQILEAVGIVDYIVLFDDKTPYSLIQKLKPNVLVKGQDWAKDKVIGRKIVDKVVRIKLKKGYSTSGIIKKIIKTYA